MRPSTTASVPAPAAPLLPRLMRRQVVDGSLALFFDALRRAELPTVVQWAVAKVEEAPVLEEWLARGGRGAALQLAADALIGLGRMEQADRLENLVAVAAARSAAASNFHAAAAAAIREHRLRGEGERAAAIFAHAARDPELGAGWTHPLQAPVLFLPGLRPNKPVHSGAPAGWLPTVELLEQHAEAIVAELSAALASASDPFAPMSGGDEQLVTDGERLADAGGWSEVRLCHRGRWSRRRCAMFPTVCRLLMVRPAACKHARPALTAGRRTPRSTA